jgi:hypothetical protein
MIAGLRRLCVPATSCPAQTPGKRRYVLPGKLQGRCEGCSRKNRRAGMKTEVVASWITAENITSGLKRRLDRCPRWCMALFFLSAVTCMNAETRSPRWKSKRSAQYAECYTVKRVERPRSHPSFLANINIHHPRKHFLHHQVHFGNISTEALNGSPIPTTPQHRNWRKKINEASSPRFFFSREPGRL